MARKSLPVSIYPVLLVIILDTLFTFLGQPTQYWQNHLSVEEGSPLGVNFLQTNPILFLIFMLVYTLLVVFLLKKLPSFWALVFGLTVFSGHLYGSGSWVYLLYLKLGFPDYPFSHWYLTLGYYFIISLITVLIVNKEIKRILK